MLKSDPRSSRGSAEIEELEDRIEKLRHSYDIFFSGLAHIDPSEKKIPIRRLISRLNEMHIKNPRIKFKFQSLVGRFVSLNQYWTRTLREIEEGRLTRGLFRSTIAKREKAKAFFSREAPVWNHEDEDRSREMAAAVALPEKPEKEEKSKRKDIRSRKITDADMDTLKYKHPLAGPDEAATTNNHDKAQQAGGPQSDGLDDKKLDRIYNEYSQARRKQGATAKDIPKERLKVRLDRQVETLQKKYQGHDIDFRVVEKDGKVLLRPVVKKPHS